MDKENLICIAQITGTHGIKGMLKVKLFADDPETLINYGDVTDKKGKKSFNFETISPYKNMFLVKMDGIDNPEDGALLRGTELHIDKSHLPDTEEDEFYYIDLIGLEARLENGEKAGTIFSVQNHGSSDLLEIRPEKGNSYFIPFTDANVPEVNMEQKFVTIVPLNFVDAEEDDEVDSKDKKA